MFFAQKKKIFSVVSEDQEIPFASETSNIYPSYADGIITLPGAPRKIEPRRNKMYFWHIWSTIPDAVLVFAQHLKELNDSYHDLASLWPGSAWPFIRGEIFLGCWGGQRVLPIPLLTRKNSLWHSLSGRDGTSIFRILPRYAFFYRSGLNRVTRCFSSYMYVHVPTR